MIFRHIKALTLTAFFIIISISAVRAESNTYIDSLLQKYSIDSNEYIGLVFLEFGSCVKCIIAPESLLKQAIDETKAKIHIVALVNCARTKEIQGFKKSHNWKYDVEPDLKNQSRSLMGIDFSSDLCIINSKGKVIVETSSLNASSKKNIEKIKKALIDDNNIKIGSSK